MFSPTYVLHQNNNAFMISSYACKLMPRKKEKMQENPCAFRKSTDRHW